MRIDMHVHTIDSFDCCSRIEDIISSAKSHRIDAVCLTDHNVFSNGRSVRSKALHTAAEAAGVLLMRGCEVSTDMGHLLCYGLKDDGWNRVNGKPYVKGGPYISAKWLCEYVTLNGGAVVAAHPFRGDTQWAKNQHYKISGHHGAGWAIEQLKDYGLCGIEVANGGNGTARCPSNVAAWQLAEKLDLCTIGGSDAHTPNSVGRCWTEAPDSIRSTWDLVQLLRRHSKLLKFEGAVCRCGTDWGSLSCPFHGLGSKK